MTALFPSLSLFLPVPIFWLHLLLRQGPATLLCLWLCAHLLLGLGFPMLPGYPSPSIRLWVYWFQWLLFSTRVPYLRDGVTPAGSRLFVLDRNEGLVTPLGSDTLVSSWLDLTPLSAASLHALSLRVCCQVVLAVSVSLGCP